MEKERIDYFDIAKAIGIWFVILGHLTTNKILLSFIYSFHIPLFFFISGYFFNRSKTILEVLKSSFKDLIIPYFCFNIFNLSICWISPYLHPELYYNLQGWDILKAAITGIFLFRNLVTPFSFLPGSALWFLVALFNIRLLAILFSRLFKNIIVLIVLSSGICILLFYQTDITLFSIESTFLAYPFFMIGFAVKNVDLKKKDYRSIWIIVLFLINICFTYINGRINIDGGDYGNYMMIFLLNGCIGTLMILFISQTPSIPTIVKKIGLLTLPILGLHFFPIYLFKTLFTLIFGAAFIQSLFFSIPISVGTLFICYYLGSLIKQHFPIVLGQAYKS